MSILKISRLTKFNQKKKKEVGLVTLSKDNNCKSIASSMSKLTLRMYIDSHGMENRLLHLLSIHLLIDGFNCDGLVSMSYILYVRY